MDKNKSNLAKAAITFGIMGLIAGLFLLFSGETLMGIGGSIASALIAFKGFSDLKKFK